MGIIGDGVREADRDALASPEQRDRPAVDGRGLLVPRPRSIALQAPLVLGDGRSPTLREDRPRWRLRSDAADEGPREEPESSHLLVRNLRPRLHPRAGRVDGLRDSVLRLLESAASLVSCTRHRHDEDHAREHPPVDRHARRTAPIPRGMRLALVAVRGRAGGAHHGQPPRSERRSPPPEGTGGVARDLERLALQRALGTGGPLEPLVPAPVRRLPRPPIGCRDAAGALWATAGPERAVGLLGRPGQERHVGGAIRFDFAS